MLCEVLTEDEATGEEAPPAPEGEAAEGEPSPEESKDQTISVLPALEEAAKYPISLGLIEGAEVQEVYAQIDATTAQITMRLGSPGEAEANPRPIKEAPQATQTAED